MTAGQTHPSAYRSEHDKDLLEFEKEVKYSHIRKSEGPKLFRCLHEYLDCELEKINGRLGRDDYRLERLKPSLLSLLKVTRIQVKRPYRKRVPITIAYFHSIHKIYVTRGEEQDEYALAVGDDWVLRLESSTGLKVTAEELGMEILAEIRQEMLDHAPASDPPMLVGTHTAQPSI